MFKSKKSFVYLAIIGTILTIVLWLAFKQAKELHRDPLVLLNRYYLLKTSSPDAAKNALTIILRQDKRHLIALKELSKIYLKEGKADQALPLLEQLHEIDPKDANISLDLAELYYDLGAWDKTKALLEQEKNLKSPALNAKVDILASKMLSSLPNYRMNASSSIYFSSSQEYIINSQVVQILLNYFYKIKTSEPKEAYQLLRLVYLFDSANILIQEELAYKDLHDGSKLEARKLFEEAYNTAPTPHRALQLAYLYMDEKNHLEAAHYFLIAALSNDPLIKTPALRGYEYTEVSAGLVPKTVETPQLTDLDRFYQLKKKNKQAAWILIQKILAKNRENAIALREAGFLAIELKNKQAAIIYLSRAYLLTYEPDLAMQLGYLYSQIDNNSLAYKYFLVATKTKDRSLELKAQSAMTNLAGLQLKTLPYPYFGELFFDPFTQSRFGLTVRPLVARAGVEHKDLFQTTGYFVFRQTDDNKSHGAVLGQLPQIYEDDVRILGLGFRLSPFKGVPIISFLELGEAYDLTNRNRQRWRGDLRSGFMYYNEFGARPGYFAKPTFSTKYYSTLYGDITYFSRYSNVIATAKTHQGIRLLQYHSSMINLYFTGRAMEDTSRYFFNNFVEGGPGIGWFPSNRYWFQLRFEHLNGKYLPAARVFNPYGKYYVNNLVQLLIYLKI